jgi:EF hand
MAMRTRTKVALGALAAGVLLTGALVGRGEAHGWGGGGRGGWGGGGMMMGHALQLFEQADGDKDGRLTGAEVDGFAAANLQRFDADGNGRLGLEEFQGLWVELTRPLRVRAFQFVDGDGDGGLTQAEVREPLGRLLDRLDRNDDGSVARDELGRPGRGPGGHDRGGDGGPGRG